MLKILVLNLGSTSFKFKLYEMGEAENLLATAVYMLQPSSHAGRRLFPSHPEPGLDVGSILALWLTAHFTGFVIDGHDSRELGVNLLDPVLIGGVSRQQFGRLLAV